MTDGGTPRRSVRVDDNLWDALGEIADDSGVSRSDLMRRGAAFIAETRGDKLSQQADIKESIESIRDENKDRQRIHGFPGYVERLLIRNIKGGMGPKALKSVAHGYRGHAAKLEELAQTIDHVEIEPGEIVDAVDRKLAAALEAEGMSNFYSNHENPFAARLGGVREGIEDRKDVITLMQSVVHSYSDITDVFADPNQWNGVRARDLPHMASDMLPEGVSRGDAAMLATELIREGVDPDDVPHALRGRLHGDEIPVEAHPTDATDTTDELTTSGAATPKPASDETRNDLQLVQLAAADGGRSSDTEQAGWSKDADRDTDSDMTDPNSDIDDPEQVNERLDDLLAAEPVGADDE
jgi:hypothetical protein